MRGNCKKTCTRLKIVGATLTAIFSLASVFTATVAWFASNQSVTATGMQIQVATPDEIRFDMYYLSSFTDSSSNTKPGNYNATTGVYSGYQKDYEDATFTKIDLEHLPTPPAASPVGIDHLWPAHKLTFALVITGGDVSKMTLTNWSEGEGNETTSTPKINASQYVRLSWAIDIFGGAYNVTKSNSDTALTNAPSVADAFSSYYAARYNNNPSLRLNDVFDYSESNLANVPPLDKDPIDVIPSIPAQEEGKLTIAFFTIEFSNSNSTFYKYNDATGYYVKNTAGNSNCYENLALSQLVFAIR